MAGLQEFVVQFGTEEQCIEHLAGLRWPGGFACVLGAPARRFCRLQRVTAGTKRRYAEFSRSFGRGAAETSGFCG
jgi:hypothetical protein